jgi:hypothetical protein
MRCRLALAAAAAVALSGCAGGTPSADLFEVNRTGEDPNANVQVLVSDGGTVTCNDQEPKGLPGKMLLEARDLARELQAQAALSIELPPGRNAVLRYEVRTESGRVAFSDTSEDRPPSFDRLAAFTKTVTEDVCGLER